MWNKIQVWDVELDQSDCYQARLCKWHCFYWDSTLNLNKTLVFKWMPAMQSDITAVYNAL